MCKILLMSLMLIAGPLSCSSCKWGQFSLFIVVHHVILFLQLAKRTGGPPPLRSPACPEGLPALSGSNWFLAQIGNLFVDRTVEVCLGVAEMGGDFSIENPEKSLIWSTRGIQRLLRCARAWLIHFDQCAWGLPQ